VEYDRKKQGLRDWPPSRLFIYYNEREVENTVASDGGAQIRDGIKSINDPGVCMETTWPFDEAQLYTKPPAVAYTEAAGHKAVAYEAVNQDLIDLRSCLASGYPVVFGFTVYDYFESDAMAAPAPDGAVLNLPQPTESSQGGHAVVLVGYDDVKQMFLVRNSWGPDWGIAGYFWMAYAYVLNPDLADDFWKVVLISS
jgi:C1A family cysteine protease